MSLTIQHSARAAIKQYHEGELSAKQLVDCMSALYEAIGDHQDASKEQVALLSSMEREIDHWKMLGYFEYEDYLEAIDPHGKARNMIDPHRGAARRKCKAIDTMHECWSGSPELLELVGANE